MFSGEIKAIGLGIAHQSRTKFTDLKIKTLIIILEPEWLNSDQIYLNGFPTSLLEEVQIDHKTIPV